MKKYYFFSGLPRSGNTILASLLNQNPQIYATGQSITASIMYDLSTITFNNLVYHSYPQESKKENLLKNVLPNYYSEVKEPFIIERGEWIIPNNLELYKKYCPNEVKGVALTRDLTEIIKSFLNHANLYPNFFLNKQGGPTQKGKVDFLLKPYSYIHYMYKGIKNLDESFLIVDYKDIVENTQETLNKIYSYYGIDKYIHDISNIPQLNGYKDELFGHNLHEINTKGMSYNKYEIELEDSVVEKINNFML